MTTDHMELRSVAILSMQCDSAPLGETKITVSIIDVLEVLHALEQLRTPAAPKGKYSAEFEEVWGEYPKKGNHSKAAAYKAWNARLKAGASMEAMVEGMRRFAAVMAAEGRDNSKIMHAATFFGPDCHYESEWVVPRAEVRRVIPDRREVIKETDEQRAANRNLWGIPELPPSSFDSGVIDAN